MKLPNHKVEFLYRFWRKFVSRAFIIDTMTYVKDRDEICLYTSEFFTEQNTSVTVDLFSAPQGSKYERPYDLEYIKKNYPEAVYTRLANDPVHRWRAETGIELIHKEPDVYEQIRTYRNWTLMSNEDKEKSDQKSIELFGTTNTKHYTDLLKNWFNENYEGELVYAVDYSGDKYCLAYISDVKADHIVLNYLDNGEQRVFGETDTFELKKGMLTCFDDDIPIETTVGRLLLNVLLVELPFNGIFKYINKSGFDKKGLEKQISDALIDDKIKVEQYKQYVDNIYFIGHFCELCVPTFSRAALTTDPNMKKLKQELLEKYKGRLTDPKVIAEIENILIAADKAYLKDDVSMRFYTPLGGKPFNIARKKMFLTVGGIEAFSKDSGKYDFIKNSLADGWTNDAMPSFANEIRKGSYNRGHETQLGGAQTKYIVRVFQDLCIVEDDCGTTKGLVVDFAQHDPKEYIGRYILINGKWVSIKREDLSKYIGNKYVMRSPMYCHTKNGLCKKCSGDVFAKLNVKHIAMYIVDISSTFTTMALKLMHGSKLELVDLGDLNKYLI